MPIKEAEIEASGAPVSFAQPGEARILVGPCSAIPWMGEVLPLHGHHSICAGRVTFADSSDVRAQIRVRTHDFEFLEGADCHLAGAWYDVEEPELYEALGLSREAARPFTWTTDIPLEGNAGPHPEKWFVSALQQGAAEPAAARRPHGLGLTAGNVLEALPKTMGGDAEAEWPRERAAA